MIERAARHGEREDAVSRRHEIGLREVVAAGRTARAEARDDVVLARVIVPFVLDAPTVSTHGALPGPESRRTASALCVLPEVARRGDDDDPLIDDALGGQRQRIGPVGLVTRRRRRKD